jgi:stage V sporulation protein R
MALPNQPGGPQPMTDEEVVQLEAAIDQIVALAKGFGLDFFPMRYEVCPADIIYTFGAYGMPNRFSHWSFGKTFHQMKSHYDFGLSKIYELVINSDPCYAFLLDTNSLLQNKLIAAHVLAHCDFFKRNARFAGTNRQMVQTMGAFANRVRQYEYEHGRETVERFLDAVLAIQEHIDPHSERGPWQKGSAGGEAPSAGTAGAPSTPFDDLWALDRLGQAAPETPTAPKREPTRDLLRFVMEHAPDLADWQREILSALRGEMLYFRPQMETKIMNEGWASLWHARIMRALDLSPAESLEFAKMHAAVLAPSRYSLNPYHLGYHIFLSIEKRHGIEACFEVRELETDVSFIRNWLTKELCDELDLYLFAKQGDTWQVTETVWEKVRDGIVRQITNCGFPYLYAEDDDYQRRRELYVRHAYEGVELDPLYLRKTLPHVHHIWGRPVHLETIEEGRAVVYTCTGDSVERAPK